MPFGYRGEASQGQRAQGEGGKQREWQGEVQSQGSSRAEASEARAWRACAARGTGQVPREVGGRADAGRGTEGVETKVILGEWKDRAGKGGVKGR